MVQQYLRADRIDRRDLVWKQLHSLILTPYKILEFRIGITIYA